MEECVKIAKNAKSYKLFLPSRIVRTGAHEFYEKLGFSKTGFVFQLDLNDLE